MNWAKTFWRKVQEEVASGASLATFFSQSSRIANGLIILPIALSNFGAEEISFWLILSSILGLQSFLDQGLTVTFTRYFSYQKDGIKRADDIKNTISGRVPEFWKLRKISAVIYSIGAVIWFTCLLIYGFNQLNSQTFFEWKWIAWIVFSISTSLQFYNNKNIAMLEGSGLLTQIRTLDGIFNLLSLVVIIIFANYYNNVYVLIILQQCIMMGVFIKNFVISNGYLIKRGDRNEYTSSVSAADYLDVFRVSWKSGVGVMLSNGLLNLMIVSLTGLNGDSRVANFLLNLRIIQIVVQLSTSPFYSRIPQMASIYATGDWEKLNYLGSSAIRNSMFLYVVGGTFVLFIGNYLFQLIATSLTIEIGWVTLILFVAYYFERTGAMFLQFFSLTNKILWHVANGVTALIFILVYYFAITLGFDSFHSLIIGYFVGNILFYAPYSFSLLYKEFPTNPITLFNKSHKLTISIMLSVVLLKVILLRLG